MGTAGAESLGAAAAREAARREQDEKKKAPAPLITEGELGRPGSGGTFNAMTGPVEKAAPRAQAAPRYSLTLPIPSLASAGEGDGVDRRGGLSEDEWRARASSPQAAIRAVLEEIKELEKNPGGMGPRTLVCEDGNPQCWQPRAASASPGSRLRAANARLQQLKNALEALEDSARQMSVPPGWLRER